MKTLLFLLKFLINSKQIYKLMSKNGPARRAGNLLWAGRRAGQKSTGRPPGRPPKKIRLSGRPISQKFGPCPSLVPTASCMSFVVMLQKVPLNPLKRRQW